MDFYCLDLTKYLAIQYDTGREHFNKYCIFRVFIYMTMNSRTSCDFNGFSGLSLDLTKCLADYYDTNCSYMYINTVLPHVC